MEIPEFEALSIPTELSPARYLRSLTAEPIGWTVVAASQWLALGDTAIGSYLAPAAEAEKILANFSWGGRSLGTAGLETIYSSSGEAEVSLQDGMSDEHEHSAHFFVQVRSHHGLGSQPGTVEFTPPFLWFFNAIPFGTAEDGGFRALRDSGTETPLAQWKIQLGEQNDWIRYIVEVDATHLRRFLRVARRVLVVQHDARFFSDPGLKELHTTAQGNTYHFSFAGRSDYLGSAGTKSFTRLLGKHLVLPFAGAPADEMEDRDAEHYPNFIVGIDHATGKDVEASSTLGASDAPYLTPVYFLRGVLQRYASEPRKYRVSTTSLTCLHLWNLQMDVNSEGLVQVYLGDLGRDLPESERAHWRSYNVPPAGGMNESRYRRDFLAQFAAADDPLAAMHRARSTADEKFKARYGSPLFLIKSVDDRLAFERLVPPTSDQQAEFERCILVLAKGTVDALQTKPLRFATNSTDDALKSLALLSKLVETLGGDKDSIMDPFHAIQAIRSTGVAHLKGSNYDNIRIRYGLEDGPSARAFERLVRDATASLISIDQLLAQSA